MNALRRFWEEHPRLSMWIGLAIGMVVIMVVSARHVGFTALQWVWLIVVTIGLAGVCTWIVTWGEAVDEGEPQPSGREQDSTTTEQHAENSETGS
jgi:hypothetical protein